MLSPAPDTPYPFIYDARISRGLRDTYLGLRSFDQGSGVFMAVETLAQKLGISESTAHRHLRKLSDHGVLEVKPQFQDGQQRTNFYLFPNPQWWVEGGCQSDTLISTNDGVETCPPEITVFSSPQQEQATPTTTGVGGSSVREGGSGWGAREVGEGAGFLSSVALTLSLARAAGADSSRCGSWTYLFDRYLHPSWLLVEFFTDLVQARQVREKGKPRKVPSRWTSGWWRTAEILVANHPLDELKATLTWLFTQHHGYLPFPVEDEYKGRISRMRVTRLAQVLDHYDELREVMDRGKPSETPPTGVEEIPLIQTPPMGVQEDGGAVEDQVATLVELFRKTRRHPVGDFDVFGWRKTFRIMLTHHQIPYDDIRLVVDALGNHRLELDYNRYFSPYDLHRNGEWRYVLGAVQVALAREKNRPTPGPPPPPPPDDDEFYRMCGEEFGT